MHYKTFWIRVVALCIDSVILSPLILLELMDASKMWMFVTLAVLNHAYYIIGHAQYGRTLGKRIMEVKVVKAHEHLPIGWPEALLRETLWIALTLLLYIPEDSSWRMPGFVAALIIIVLDVLLAWIHPHHRSLRDFIAKTVVVRSANP